MHSLVDTLLTFRFVYQIRKLHITFAQKRWPVHICITSITTPLSLLSACHKLVLATPHYPNHGEPLLSATFSTTNEKSENSSQRSTDKDRCLPTGISYAVSMLLCRYSVYIHISTRSFSSAQRLPALAHSKRGLVRMNSIFLD